ncbi:translation initiation factor IF-2-like [Lutra lutra]|uniref:translation initiation factor IF-2-like n=1 Tax=Lutra lutra TaxID=9657 RepID=UPI001FD1D900|nr:translation initiation factor IF-2-like [Lutra lutra]
MNRVEGGRKNPEEKAVFYAFTYTGTNRPALLNPTGSVGAANKSEESQTSLRASAQGREAPGSAGGCAPAFAAIPRRHAPARGSRGVQLPAGLADSPSRVPSLISGSPGPSGETGLCNPRSPRQGPRQDPRRAPALRRDGLPRGAPIVARTGTATSPLVGAHTFYRPRGPATHRLEAPGCPHRPAPRPCCQKAARAASHPQPPAQGRPGTRDSGQWHGRRSHPPRPGAGAHPRACPWNSPAPGESWGRRRRRRSTVTRVQSGGRDGAAPWGPRRAGCGVGALGGAAALPAAGWRLQRVGPRGATAGDRAVDCPERRERNWLSLGSAERSQLLPGARICILSREGGEVTVWPLPKVWVFGVAVARALMAEKLSLSSRCSRMWSRWGPASSCDGDRRIFQGDLRSLEVENGDEGAYLRGPLGG